MKTSTIRYVVIAFIVLALAALSILYFSLNARKETTNAQDSARGGSAGFEPFAARVGSTYENVAGSIAEEATTTSKKTSSTLQRIGKTPVAGMAFVGNGSTTRLRFVERSTGYVFDASLENGELTRLTNTLLPKVYEGIISDVKTVLLRTIGDTGEIQTILGALASSSQSGTAGPLSQMRLPDNILSLAISPSGREIFYIADGAEGVTGIRASIDGKTQKKIFSSPLSGWRVRWLESESGKSKVLSDRIVLTQNPSDGVMGFAYSVGEDGALSSIVRNIPGLTLLPRSGGALIYGSSNNGLSLFVRLDDGSTPALLPVRTVAEKCVWAPGIKAIAYCAVPQTAQIGNFLDAWYRGEAHSADAWWRIDASAVSAENFYTPGDALDVENPIIDESGRYIAFMNANDKSLWLVDTSHK